MFGPKVTTLAMMCGYTHFQQRGYTIALSSVARMTRDVNRNEEKCTEFSTERNTEFVVQDSGIG
jgi:hypothetical protein